jgi:hypothetical protein
VVGSAGITLNSFKLLEGATTLATGSITSTASGVGSFTFFGTTFDQYNTLFSSSLSFSPLLSGHTYELEIKGNNSYNTGGAFAGSFSVTAAPVPEPEEWAMMRSASGWWATRSAASRKAWPGLHCDLSLDA